MGRRKRAMRLDTEFIQLPFTFDADRLAQEISVFSDGDWQKHPTGFQGNAAIRLISAFGEENDDMSGPMLPTRHLERCPYIKQVISTFKSVFGRSRLMRLAGDSTVPSHSDVNYHWYDRVRIHVPIITFPSVRFHCGERDIHMGRGEAWIFDNWRNHMVTNPTTEDRVHLVFDTSGAAAFWDMVDRGYRPFANSPAGSFQPQFVPYRPGDEVRLTTEKYNAPDVMSPGELDALTSDIVQDLRAAQGQRKEAVDRFAYLVRQFCREWRTAWTLYGHDSQGWPVYRALLDVLREDLQKIEEPLVLASNGAKAQFVLYSRVIVAALTADQPATAQPSQPAVQDAAANTDYPVDINTRAQGSGPMTLQGVVRHVGRNEPCTCGSGKKYKHCHGVI